MKFTIIRYSEVSSTNAIALSFAEQGAEALTVITAESQSEGRGRRRRQFVSPVGGLYMSVILRPVLLPDRLALITLAAGVACSRAIEKCTGVSVQLKWPNDLYMGEFKVGGILTEAGPYSAVGDKIPYVIVGIGLNVNSRISAFPPELQDKATSLYNAGQCEYDKEELLTAIIGQLEELVSLLAADAGPVLSSWQERDFLLGRQIVWGDAAGNTLSGYGAGIQNDGCYLLRTNDGELHPILAGDLLVIAI